MLRWLKHLFRRRTCIQDGCKSQFPNHLDDKCLVCRLPMGEEE